MYVWNCFKHFLRNGLRPLPENPLQGPTKRNKHPLAWGTENGPQGPGNRNKCTERQSASQRPAKSPLVSSTLTPCSNILVGSTPTPCSKDQP